MNKPFMKIRADFDAGSCNFTAVEIVCDTQSSQDVTFAVLSLLSATGLIRGSLVAEMVKELVERGEVDSFVERMRTNGWTIDG